MIYFPGFRLLCSLIRPNRRQLSLIRQADRKVGPQPVLVKAQNACMHRLGTFRQTVV